MIDPGFLTQTRLFEEFTPGEAATAAARFAVRACRPGEAVVSEGRPADHLYLIKSGAFRVTRTFGDNVLTVATLNPHDHFGEMSLIDEHPHSATVVADGEGELLTLSRADLRALLAESDSMRAKFWQAIAIELTRRIRSTTNTVRDYVGINKALCENDKFREFYILCNSH